MALSWPSKDPDEVLDYEIDWAPRLAGDTILSSQWELGDDVTLVVDSHEVNNKRTKVWLSGGTLGQTYDVLNRIVTAGGRTMDQTVRLNIKTK